MTAAGPEPGVRPRTWGARFFVTDALAIVVVAGLVAWLHGALTGPERWLVPLPAVALGHFFLFCNVFRVRTRYELLWASVFLVNVVAWWLADALLWRNVLVVQTPITLLAIALEVRSPEYHGLRADRWNPDLQGWLAG